MKIIKCRSGNAFVFYDIKRYDIRGKKYLESLDKFYLCDTGIRNTRMKGLKYVILQSGCWRSEVYR